MKDFCKCRSCYNHIGGIYAVEFFNYLLKKDYINYINPPIFNNAHCKIPLLITNKGIEFFKFFEGKVNAYNFAYACLDGTEKKPHLGGKSGDLVLKCLLSKNLIHRDNENRCLYLTDTAKEIFIGKADFNVR
jgi:hypothetical protein